MQWRRQQRNGFRVSESQRRASFDAISARGGDPGPHPPFSASRASKHYYSWDRAVLQRTNSNRHVLLRLSRRDGHVRRIIRCGNKKRAAPGEETAKDTLPRRADAVEKMTPVNQITRRRARSMPFLPILYVIATSASPLIHHTFRKEKLIPLNQCKFLISLCGAG